MAKTKTAARIHCSFPKFRFFKSVIAVAEIFNQNKSMNKISKFCLDNLQARDDVTEFLEDKMTSDALLVSGSKSSSVKAMEHMFANCDKTRTSMIKIDDVADVLNEAQVMSTN